MKKKYAIILSFVATICSCKTVDLEQSMQPVESTETKVEKLETEQTIAESEAKKLLIQQVVETKNKIIYVDKPIYVPAQEKIEKEKGVDATYGAEKNIVEPSDYLGSTMIYDYNKDFSYEIHTQIGQTTNITLQQGEQIIGEIANADPMRFDIGINYSIENGITVFHVFVKPKQSGCINTLTICTNKRTYNLLVRSYSNVFMPVVRWNYYDDQMQYNTLTSPDLANIEIENNYVDPKFLSFDYALTYFRKPDWCPIRVYDDGAKTYIVMPEEVLQKEIPACFENKNEIVNYRVSDNIFIIDKLITKITLKADNKTVSILKKKD